MARLTPEEVAEKHARRLKAAVPDIERGIDRVTRAPGEAAAAKEAKMKSRLMEKIDDGTWARRVKSVSVDEWRTKTKEKGLQRIAAGIDAAQSKQEDFYAQLLPHIDKANEKIKSMPDLTLEDNISRMTSFIREMGKFSKK